MTFDADKISGQVERLYRREAKLLQNGEYKTWVSSMFTEDVHYHMPVVSVRDHRRDAVRGEHELSYFDENYRSLMLRADKFGSEMSWTEYPPSRTRYFFQLMDLEPYDNGEINVVCNFILYFTRLDSVEHIYVGERNDRMRMVDNEWRIAKRKIIVDRSRLSAHSLCVFF